MPYQSMKQSRFMHSQHPTIAAKWDAEYPDSPRSMGSVGGQGSHRLAPHHHSHHSQNPTGSAERSTSLALDRAKREREDRDEMLHTEIRGLLRDVGDDS